MEVQGSPAVRMVWGVHNSQMLLPTGSSQTLPSSPARAFLPQPEKNWAHLLLSLESLPGPTVELEPTWISSPQVWPLTYSPPTCPPTFHSYLSRPLHLLYPLLGWQRLKFNPLSFPPGSLTQSPPLVARAPFLGSHALRTVLWAHMSLGRACVPCLALSPTCSWPGRVQFTSLSPVLVLAGTGQVQAQWSLQVSHLRLTSRGPGVLPF